MIILFLVFVCTRNLSKETYISSRGDTLLYRLLRPEVMKPDEKYPFGAFPAWCRRAAMIMRNNWFMGQAYVNPVNREKYPAFILAPQCPETDIGIYGAPFIFCSADMPLEVPVSPLFSVR